MKIRVMGTKDECLAAMAYYRELEKDSNVKFVQVSDLYPNRGSSTLFRLYVEVEYYCTIIETVNARQPLPGKRR
ncbi:MAG: hypothetical protein IIX02_02005 [Clostridia bacterium]|nr:hypothetical protein [Clostridia bacterium]